MKMVKDLEKLKPGDHFMLKDIEWVCLDPDYTEYDGQKGIFAIMAKLNGKSIKFCDNEDRDDWSNYAKSPIRTYLEKEYGEKLKDVTLVHKCDLRTDNGDELYPPVYDKVFILSIFEYFQYVNYIPRYDDWHRLRSANRGHSSGTWGVYTSGYVYGSGYAFSALQCAPACVIQKSNNLRPTPRSQKKKETNMKNKFEIYEGRTEMNRVKKYVLKDLKTDYEGMSNALQRLMIHVWAALASSHSNNFVEWNFTKNMKVLKGHQQLYSTLYFFGFRLNDEYKAIIEGKSDLYEAKI